MLRGVIHPLCSCVAPVTPNLATLAATAREAVADPAHRDTAIGRVMLANGHAIDCERV